MKIAVPTDFSDHSLTALRFAVEFANVTQAELHIIHAFHVKRVAGSFISPTEVIKRNLQEDMSALVSGISATYVVDAPIKSSVIHGFVDDVIMGYSQNNHIDLLIMGTQGANSVANVLFGSVTQEICDQSKVPVLAVPRHIESLKKDGLFLLALDSEEVKPDVDFDTLREISKAYNSLIDIVHIQESKEDAIDFDPFASVYLEDRMGEFQIHESEDVMKGLHDYVDSHDASMLVMLKRKHTFFEKLLYHRYTKDSLASLNIPIMVIDND